LADVSLIESHDRSLKILSRKGCRSGHRRILKQAKNLSLTFLHLVVF